MSLRKGDSLVGMAILPGQIVADVAQAQEAGLIDEEVEIDEDVILDEAADLETAELKAPSGPWILVVTNGGYGKRVPVTQFRLQNRAGMGIVVTKFRKKGDTLAALHIVNDGAELMMVTSRGIIIRQAVNAISSQSRAATGVRVQRLDEDDAIAAVAIVPPTSGEEALELAASELAGDIALDEPVTAEPIAVDDATTEPTVVDDVTTEPTIDTPEAIVE